MNLWFRLLYYLITARWRPTLVLPDATSRMTFRVLPLDLDTSLHLNNGRYLTMMDLGRLDLMVASGLVGAAMRHRWTPIANAVEIRFRRELRLFDKIELRSRIVCWTETEVVIEQIFVPLSGPREGQVASRALFAGGLYDRKAKEFVAISRLMREIGISGESPPARPDVTAFLQSLEQLRDMDRPGDA